MFILDEKPSEARVFAVVLKILGFVDYPRQNDREQPERDKRQVLHSCDDVVAEFVFLELFLYLSNELVKMMSGQVEFLDSSSRAAAKLRRTSRENSLSLKNP